MIWVLYQPECYFNFELHKFRSFKELFEFLKKQKEALVVIPSTKEEIEIFVDEIEYAEGHRLKPEMGDFFIYVYREVE